MPYCKDDFDHMACALADCDHDGEELNFQSECHPEGGTKPVYLFKNGVLVIACAVCGKGIVDFYIAEKAPEPAGVIPLRRRRA